MRQRVLLGLVASTLCWTVAGCNTCETAPNSPGPQAGPFIGPGPGGPGFAPMPPGGGKWQSDVPLPPAPFDSQSKSCDPLVIQKDLTWTPAAPLGGGVIPGGSIAGLLQPGQPPSVRLYPPEFDKSPQIQQTPLFVPATPTPYTPADPKTDEIIKPMEPVSTSPFPVGIPQFSQVSNKVANGLRPSLDDGLDWLQQRGYKTVLFIHEPGTIDSADRKQVEKRGMKFVDLEVSPATLSRQHIESFDRIINDSAALPLFVYDRDGALAGGMWYLHLRIYQQSSDEAARLQAQTLGLREDSESHRQMLAAANNLLQTK